MPDVAAFSIVRQGDRKAAMAAWQDALINKFVGSVQRCKFACAEREPVAAKAKVSVP